MKTLIFYCLLVTSCLAVEQHGWPQPVEHHGWTKPVVTIVQEELPRKILYVVLEENAKCPPCKYERRELKKLGWGPAYLREVTVEAAPYKVAGTPAFLLVESGRLTYKSEGYLGYKDVAKIYNKETKQQLAIKQCKQAVAKIKEVYRSAWGYIPHWNWPGDLSQHLQHTHHINTTGMSTDDMERIHDSIHDRGGRHAK